MNRQMANHNVVLSTTGLSLGYGNQTVLQGVTIEVQSGEFWVLLGQNGSGKTTLLRAFLGLLSPQTGHLWFHPELTRRERVGFVPQRCDLNPTLPTTVREFVLLGLVGIRVSRAEQNERLSWALEKMGLEGVTKSNYWLLSGGQRQRALVARALVRQPTVLFLDEPTNNLDLATEDTLLRLLAALNKDEQQTLLLVTHDIGIAARYATHVALLHSGTVVAGPSRIVLMQSNLKRIYGTKAAIPSDAPPLAPEQMLASKGIA